MATTTDDDARTVVRLLAAANARPLPDGAHLLRRRDAPALSDGGAFREFAAYAAAVRYSDWLKLAPTPAIDVADLHSAVCDRAAGVVRDTRAAATRVVRLALRVLLRYAVVRALGDRTRWTVIDDTSAAGAGFHVQCADDTDGGECCFEPVSMPVGADGDALLAKRVLERAVEMDEATWDAMMDIVDEQMSALLAALSTPHDAVALFGGSVPWASIVQRATFVRAGADPCISLRLARVVCIATPTTGATSSPLIAPVAQPTTPCSVCGSHHTLV